MQLRKFLSLFVMVAACGGSGLAPVAVAAETESTADNVMKLTFLGTGSPRPSTKRFGPAILVEAGPHKVLVDAGPGLRERLFETGGFELLTSLDQVFLTHLHFDHAVSVPGLWLSGWLYGRRVPLNVFGPAGTSDMMADFEEAYRWDIDYRALVGVPRAGTEIAASDLKPGDVVQIGELKIVAFHVEHMPYNLATQTDLEYPGDTLGFRFDYRGRSVLFSGDTRSTPDSEIIRYGQGVDVLVHEVQVPSPGDSKEAKLANVSLAVHTTPEQAAYVFSQTRPKLAVYSHIIPAHATAGELERLTRPGYDGALLVAEDFTTIVVGDEIQVGSVERLRDDVFEQSRVLETHP